MLYQGQPPRGVKSGAELGAESGDEVVNRKFGGSKKPTAVEVFDILGQVEEAREANDNIDQVEIAGVKVEDPVKAYENLEGALKVVEGYFGSRHDIKLEEIHFEKLPGNQVGEAKEDGIYIDPVMMMHPMRRLAHVMAHEFAHDKKNIMNEQLTESYVELWFKGEGDEDIEHGYEKAMESFKEFAEVFDKNGDLQKGILRIYDLYYKHDFHTLYKEFEVNHLNKLETEEKKDEAFTLFQTAFPELSYVADEEKSGKFGLRKLPTKNADVIDLDAYRKRVEQIKE
ncbi:MAG: hypothetical protein AAB373_00125 [Patescibacteria group bacterium]